MKHGDDIDVRCPFYHGLNIGPALNQLCCEGITDDCITVLAFRSRAPMKEQMKLFCCDCYQMCEIYRMLMDAKY